jgi:peptidyl-prolyl cis-trans isomerase A (cyclophilin A)
MRLLFTILISGAALLAQAPATKTGAAPKAAQKTGATKTGAAGAGSLLNPAALTRRAPDNFKVKFATTAGDFTAEVHRDWAPLGADRFYNLVRSKFFDGETFFRVVPNFIVQFGLHGNPAVNRAWENAKIKDDPVKQHNTRGTLVFATAGPETRTTQLFINLRDNTGSLDPQGFAPFGTVIEGMENVDKIFPGYGEQPKQNADRPGDKDNIADSGDAYLKKNFPNLTRITSTSIILPEGAAPAPAAKKATPAAPAKKQ